MAEETLVQPLNPVEISSIQKESSNEFESEGLLFDHLGEQYRFRTNDDLTVGEKYIIDADLTREKTVLITNSWEHTGYK